MPAKRRGRQEDDGTRPVFLPQLAKALIELRATKGWKQSQAADIATRRNLAVGYQALRWLEDGKIKNPEPELLKAVADLYEVPYDQIAALMFEERYGVAVVARDLPRHSIDRASDPHQGETDVPASGRSDDGVKIAQPVSEVRSAHAAAERPRDDDRDSLTTLAEQFHATLAARPRPAAGAVEDAVRRAHAILAEIVERLDDTTEDRRPARRGRGR